MAVYKPKSNVAKSSKKSSFKFKWWMAAIGVGVVALVGILVLRFSHASAPYSSDIVLNYKLGDGSPDHNDYKVSACKDLVSNSGSGTYKYYTQALLNYSGKTPDQGQFAVSITNDKNSKGGGKVLSDSKNKIDSLGGTSVIALDSTKVDENSSIRLAVIPKDHGDLSTWDTFAQQTEVIKLSDVGLCQYSFTNPTSIIPKAINASNSVVPGYSLVENSNDATKQNVIGSNGPYKSDFINLDPAITTDVISIFEKNISDRYPTSSATTATTVNNRVWTINEGSLSVTPQSGSGVAENLPISFDNLAKAVAIVKDSNSADSVWVIYSGDTGSGTTNSAVRMTASGNNVILDWKVDLKTQPKNITTGPNNTVWVTYGTNSDVSTPQLTRIDESYFINKQAASQDSSGNVVPKASSATTDNTVIWKQWTGEGKVESDGSISLVSGNFKQNQVGSNINLGVYHSSNGGSTLSATQIQLTVKSVNKANTKLVSSNSKQVLKYFKPGSKVSFTIYKATVPTTSTDYSWNFSSGLAPQQILLQGGVQESIKSLASQKITTDSKVELSARPYLLINDITNCSGTTNLIGNCSTGGVKYLYSPGFITSDGTNMWMVNTGDNSISQISALNGSLIHLYMPSLSSN